MSNKKSTKRALLLSVMSMLLCVAMLLGTTFAWFTDSVTSGINQIVAGNLDVELYHTNETDTDEKVNATTKLFDKVDLWEPGVMVWEKLTVVNEGNLALKYNLTVNFDEEGATKTATGKTLADVLQIALLDAQPTRDTIKSATLIPMKTFALNANDVMLKATESDEVYVAIYWQPTDNDNEYNMNNGQTTVLTIDLGVKLVATQVEYEVDSFNNTYDADAYYPGAAAGQSKTNSLAKQFSEAQDGDTIYLEPLNYGLLTLGSGAYPYDYPANLTIVGQEGTAFTGFGINDEVINGWTFKNIDFIGDKTDNSGNNDGISISTKATVKGITVEDCTFTNGANFSMINTSNATFEDVVVKNCSFSDDDVVALLLQGVTNITVDKCTFDTVGHNAIQTNSTKGEFAFTNNVVNGTVDRAIRVANKGANITVTGNTIVTNGDADGQLMKVSGVGSETITLSGNTWNGKTDAEVSAATTGTDFIVK